MFSTGTLKSVQDATQLQGVVGTDKKQSNDVTVTPRQNQRKALQSPEKKPKPLKVAKTVLEATEELFDESDITNKENIDPNIQVLKEVTDSIIPAEPKKKKQLNFDQADDHTTTEVKKDQPQFDSSLLLRRSCRLAQVPLTEEEEFLFSENPNLKELSNTPSIKFSNRFEKTPEAIAVTVEPRKNQSDSTLSQERLNKDFKNLKNHYSEKVEVLSDKINGVRICQDKNQKQFPQIFSVKTPCSKVRFFAPSLEPEEHRKRYGEVVIDQKKTEETLCMIRKLKEEIKSQNSNQHNAAHPILNLEKLKEDPSLYAYLITRDKPVKKYHRIPITYDIVTKWGYKSQKPRNPTQLSVFGISAKHYAQLFGIMDPDDELTHGVAYSLGGLDGVEPQVRKNLFVATAGANTWMMLGEDLVRYLLIDHKDKVKKVFVSVEIQFIPGTKIAKRIDYSVAWTRVNSIVEKSISFKINALRYDAPAKVLEKYLRKIADRELEHQHPGEVLSNNTNNQNKATLKSKFMDEDEIAAQNNNNNNQIEIEEESQEITEGMKSLFRMM